MTNVKRSPKQSRFGLRHSDFVILLTDIEQILTSRFLSWIESFSF